MLGNNILDTNQLLNLDNFDYGFGSSAANLEYSILSNMLGGSSSQINEWKSPSQDTSFSTPTTVYTNPILGDPFHKLDHSIQNSPKSNSISPSLFKKPLETTNHGTSISYARASKPYSYADGYHYLINYVKQK